MEVWRIVRLLCLVCLLGAVGSLAWNMTASSDHDYLRWEVGSPWDHAKVCLCSRLACLPARALSAEVWLFFVCTDCCCVRTAETFCACCLLWFGAPVLFRRVKAMCTTEAAHRKMDLL